MAHRLWEPQEQLWEAPVADIELYPVALIISAFFFGVVADEAARACRRALAGLCAPPTGSCSREVQTEPLSKVWPSKATAAAVDGALRGGNAGLEPGGESPSEPSHGSCDTDAAGSPCTERLDYEDDSCGRTEAAPVSSAAEASSSAQSDKPAGTQLGRPAAEVYRYDDVIDITPSSLQEADPLAELISQHVGGYHPGELNRLLRGVGDEEGQTLTVADRRQLAEYLHLFSRIMIQQDRRARETTQLCIVHIERVLALDREAKMLHNDMGRRAAERADRRARVLRNDDARVAATLVSAFQWALVEIGATFLALLHEGVLRFWDQAPALRLHSPWTFCNSSLNVVRYFGTSFVAWVPVVLLASLLFKTCGLRDMVSHSWNGNFIMSFIFSIILEVFGELVLSRAGGDARAWRYIMSLWTLQFLATSFVCHPNMARAQAAANYFLTGRKLPPAVSSGCSTYDEGCLGHGTGRVDHRVSTASEVDSSAKSQCQPDLLATSVLDRNVVWRWSWALYVYPVCAVLLSMPAQQVQLLARLFAGWDERFTGGDLIIL